MTSYRRDSDVTIRDPDGTVRQIHETDYAHIHHQQNYMQPHMSNARDYHHSSALHHQYYHQQTQQIPQRYNHVPHHSYHPSNAMPLPHSDVLRQQIRDQHQRQYQSHLQQMQRQQELQERREKDKARDDRLRRLRHLRKDFFEVPLIENKYTVEQIIGEGASGVVCSAIDTTTNEPVAVKRVSRGFDKVPVSVRILRELKFLRLLRGHENIVEIKDILMPASTRNFDDVFVVFELMPTDLNHILRSKTELSNLHIQYFMYQLIRGLHFLHSSGVFHRDLKPNNILINKQCMLRICDFGLARANFDNTPDMAFWTDYVATRWYRAPELIMTHSTRYSTKIDIWSAGCILAEMLGKGKPLFPGKDGYDQLQLMMSVLGSPGDEAIAKVQSAKVRKHFQMLPPQRRQPFAHIFPHAEPEACSLLEWLLEFDPEKRPDALQALSHPYFKEFYEPGAEIQGKPIPPSEFAFERMKLTPDAMRRLFLQEISLYHPEHAKDLLQDIDRYGGFDLPSQAETFASAMQSVQDGIAQRKTTSMPKSKFKPLSEAYRAKREAERKRSGNVGEGGDAAMKDANGGRSNVINGVQVGSSSSWYDGSSRRTRTKHGTNHYAGPAEVADEVLESDPMAMDGDDEEELGMVRVASASIEYNDSRKLRSGNMSQHVEGGSQGGYTYAMDDVRPV